MGLSEREYMRTPESSGPSNFTYGLIGIAVLAALVFLSRQRNRSPSADFSISRTVEEQMISFDPTYNRHERLARISPLDINSATYEDLRLLPRVTDAIASGIISARPISTLEELDEVYGVGPKTIELIRPHITLGENVGYNSDNGG